MSIITRRTALIGSAALITTTATPLVAHAAYAKGTLAAEDPLVGLWRERQRLRAQLDRLSDQCTAIEEALRATSTSAQRL